ncbi:MAG: hypothetical protein A3K03_11435 [Bdellovibrionales bacterium RIFOXYD1_FULL_44_7]|nr:MAG: hypothetical protein A3K03_11435 [Bdellovibrionales bacterium RIFOXYD1_FULL_44_7]
MKGPVVLLVAVIGLAANLISMKFLFSAKKHSLNVRAAYLHVLFDSLGSVAAIITGAVLWIYNWRVIDPIVTVVLAVLMLVSSWELIKESIGILMESTPSDVDVSKVKEDLSKIEGVREVHDLHVWAVSSGRLAMSAHLISIDPEQEVLTRAYQMLQKKYGIVHTTIQVEHPEKFSSSRCYDCAK